ncbi:MAG TPA: TolC family protein [Tepidisphaeraceae bacterium]|nr:TolC family protein [Tepidisphaeraceae bacterium]
MSKPLWLILVATVLFAGCTPQSYKRSADRQVHDILRDRKLRTLGYVPETVAETTVPTEPDRTAYAKIPQTPIPPPTTLPIEPPSVELQYGPLGPEMLFPPGFEGGAPIDIQVGALGGLERLRLGPPAPGDAPIRFDLFRALAYGVQHSRTYKDQMENVYETALGVTLERHLFTPRPFANIGARVSGGEEDVDYEAALSVTNQLGVRQRLPYGGEIVAQALVDFVQAVNGNVAEGETAALALSASIPLLRGAGWINLEGLISSERQLIYRIRQFEEFRRDFVIQVAGPYFDLLTAQQRIVNELQSLENNRALTEKTQALFAAGRAPFLEVQRSLQNQLRSENTLVNVQNSYQNAVDRFKLILGMPIDAELEVIPLELEVVIPQYSDEEAIALAYQYRLDLKTAFDVIEDAQRGVSNAKNGLLPDLDVVANTRIENEPGDPARRIDDKTWTYNAGVELGLPLDRLAERNAYRRALIRLQQAQRNYEELKDEVALEARQRLRSIRSAQISLEIARSSIELAQRRLENANELLRLGSRDSRNVVEALQDLTRAQNDYEGARADLQIAILQFLRDTGTLRVDPTAGTVGHVLDRGGRGSPHAKDPAGRNSLQRRG